MSTNLRVLSILSGVALAGAVSVASLSAQAAATATETQTQAKPPAPAATSSPAPVVPVPAVTPPPGYVIGADDVLSIVFWRDKDMSGDFTVRPDGKIALPLVNDVQAAGLTPEQLRDGLTKAATKYMEDPNITVMVKQINSRNVYITGSVSKPGTYPLTDGMTVLQLIAKAGGLLEYADSKNIVLVHVDRRPDGEPWSLKINYKEMLDRRNLKQNVELKPGDTLIVR